MPPLISTPLLTTRVVSVKWGEAELPRERARLYEAVIKVILQAQYLDDDPTRQELVNWGGPWEEQRDWLSYWALEMQRGDKTGAANSPEKRVWREEFWRRKNFCAPKKFSNRLLGAWARLRPGPAGGP